MEKQRNAFKDKKAVIRTKNTEWSIDYPVEKEYRHITSRSAYRWYKKGKNNEKEYWNNGEFYPYEPGEEYEKENENRITMYSYYDEMYRWYNGIERGYSTRYSSTPPGSSYKYKDTGLTSYTSWSKYKTYSDLNNSNRNYREEKINIHSRYMIKYDIRSFEVLNEYVTRDKLEEKLIKTLEELNADSKIYIKVKFKYKY